MMVFDSWFCDSLTRCPHPQGHEMQFPFPGRCISPPSEPVIPGSRVLVVNESASTKLLLSCCALLMCFCFIIFFCCIAVVSFFQKKPCVSLCVCALYVRVCACVCVKCTKCRAHICLWVCLKVLMLLCFPFGLLHWFYTQSAAVCVCVSLRVSVCVCFYKAALAHMCTMLTNRWLWPAERQMRFLGVWPF